MRDQVARHHHQAGGVLVETMHDTGARHIGQCAIMKQQCILQGTLTMAGGRVHHEISRLVDDDNSLVLVNNIERNIFGHTAVILFDRLYSQLQLLITVYFDFGFDQLPIEQYLAFLDPLLETATRIIRKHLGQGDIQPFA